MGLEVRTSVPIFIDEQPLNLPPWLYNFYPTVVCLTDQLKQKGGIGRQRNKTGDAKL